MELAEVKIFRMTHIENIPHILRHGITHKDSPNSNPNFITIGDVSLIDTRNDKEVSDNNGDFLDDDSPKIILGDFTFFYFGVKMPMLYVIQNGGNFIERATSPENIIYLGCSLEQVYQLIEVCYFSDGHAIDNLTSFYTKSKISELTNLLDWDSIKASYRAGHENLNIKRKKQAEFLISGYLQPQFIYKFGCYNEAAKIKLMEMEIEEDKIRIIPNCYY